MTSITQLTDQEIEQQAGIIARHIFMNHSPATINPIATYGVFVQHHIQPPQAAYLDFLRAFTALYKPGWTELNSRINGDVVLLERIEDAVADQVYTLAYEAEGL